MYKWIICDFSSFSTVFQSYQDDDWLIMKVSVCSGTPFTVEKISPRAGFELGTAGSAGQHFTHGAPTMALERSVTDYWSEGGGLNMFYWIQTLVLSFCSSSKHLVSMEPLAFLVLLLAANLLAIHVLVFAPPLHRLHYLCLPEKY